MRWRAGTTPRPVNLKLRDFGRVPYDLYGVKYIDLVSLGVNPGSQSWILNHTPLFFGARSGFEMCFDIGSLHLGCWGRNTSPHAQGCDLSWTVSHIINHDRSQPCAYGIQTKEVYGTYCVCRRHRTAPLTWTRPPHPPTPTGTSRYYKYDCCEP